MWTGHRYDRKHTLTVLGFHVDAVLPGCQHQPMSLGVELRHLAWATDAGVQSEADLHGMAFALTEDVTATHQLRTREGSEDTQPPLRGCIAARCHYRTAKQDQQHAHRLTSRVSRTP